MVLVPEINFDDGDAAPAAVNSGQRDRRTGAPINGLVMA